MAAPANDNFADAEVFTFTAEEFTSAAYSAVEATTEANEPLAFEGSSYDSTVWWRFTPPEDGNYVLDTLQSGSADTVLVVYMVPSDFAGDLSTLTLVAGNDQGGSTDFPNASKVTTYLHAGDDVAVQVGSYYDGSDPSNPGDAVVLHATTPSWVDPSDPGGGGGDPGDSGTTTTKAVTTSQAVASGGEAGYFDLPTPMFLSVFPLSFDHAPAAMEVDLNMAPAGAVVWAVDGVTIWTDDVDENGEYGPFTLTSQDTLEAGDHTLTATAADGTVATATITFAEDPPILPGATGDDTPPVAVADSVQRWVLQDLMPGGLGSWVMRPNPGKQQPIPVTRNIQAEHTTARGGLFHVYEGQSAAWDWTFEGYCPNQAYYDQLVAYGALNRRIYLHDHHGLAYVVAIMGIDLVPRKRQQDDDGSYNDWAHDWTAHCVMYDVAPQVPVEAP